MLSLITKSIQAEDNLQNLLQFEIRGQSQRKADARLAAEPGEAQKVLRMPRKFEELSHKDLIHRLGAEPGSRELFDEFYARYHGFISSVVVRKFSNSRLRKYAQPGDVVQQVYMNLLKNEAKALRDFRSEYENGVWAWLRTISHFTLLSIKENRSWLDVDNLPTADRRGFVVENGMPGEITEEVNMCLEEIAATRRQGYRDKLIFLLKADGMSTEEIAACFDDLSEKRIAGVCTEVKQELQQRLKARGINPTGK